MQEQEQKLRDEYLGFGGSANSPIPNYFLYIIIGISFLAVRWACIICDVLGFDCTTDADPVASRPLQYVRINNGLSLVLHAGARLAVGFCVRHPGR